MIKRFLLFWSIMFLIIAVAFAQQTKKIVQVGAGEYVTTYRTDDGNMYMTTRGSNNTYNCTKIRVKNIRDVAGAQYTVIALDSTGAVFIVGINQSGISYVKDVPLDAGGNAFNGNAKIYGWFQSYLTLKNGKIFMWGVDLLNINNGLPIPAPVSLPTPPGREIKKLVTLTAGEPSLMALTTDGMVYIYSKKQAFPLKVKLASPARDIAGIGSACYVVETKNDLLAWGYLGSYLGVKDFSIAPISIKKKWVAAGCEFPSKELVGNYNTLHIIDANDNMFGAGENIQGEVGNGKQYPAWKNYLSGPYAWDWKHGQMITAPVQIKGRFKNICTSNSVTFYHYAQDMDGNWYSWGRNKSRSLGNGITMSVNDEAIYPNALNVPAPQLATPLNVKWKVLPKITPEIFLPPLIANAGVNQYTYNSSTTLIGSASSQQGGKIKSYHWANLGGEAAIITNPASADAKVTGLQKGIYTFRLTVKNNVDSTSVSDVIVQKLQ